MLEEPHFDGDKDAEIAALRAALATCKTLISDLSSTLQAERTEAALRIAKLQARIDRFTRKIYGKSSEKLEQFRLFIEDLEGDVGAEEAAMPELDVALDPELRSKPDRTFSDKLERKIVRREPVTGTCCPDCGDTLRLIGEESDEMLDAIAQAWEVIRTVRPKYGCRACDKIVQAPPPVKAIAKGRLSFRTLAHIMVSKWCYHLPFYRQAQMMAAKGVDIDRSTLARATGYSAGLLDPIANRLHDILITRNKIHTDDTHMPLLAQGNGGTRKAHLWTFVADDANSASTLPPIAWYLFSTSRSGEIVEAALGDFNGHLQADGFSGYNRIYANGFIKEVGCWAHWRRKIHDQHLSLETELTRTTLAYMQQLYRIEEEIRGLPPEQRLAIRRSRSRPIVRALRRYLKAQLAQMSRRSDTAKAIQYGFNRWPAMVRFLFNGNLEPDNLIAERSIRGFTVGRRNWLFAGSIAGGERAAKILTIIETCKLNDVEPEAYIADVMEKIADDWPASRWDELMPWNWKAAQDQSSSIAKAA